MFSADTLADGVSGALPLPVPAEIFCISAARRQENKHLHLLGIQLLENIKSELHSITFHLDSELQVLCNINIILCIL